MSAVWMPNIRTVRVDAATAGQQAEGDLGEAELGPLDVEGDAVVAGQRDLQAATEGGAVDRGDDGLAEGLQAPQQRPCSWVDLGGHHAASAWWPS